MIGEGEGRAVEIENGDKRQGKQL
ncbi:hypothetical protein RDI58_011447 [Solanum bulbocastanum]|uniref:Uncharacterized protein n=1 Tax=Solanum bulbocastanum TaxID=147425 RepID=A0AAN8TY11_SOLBU